MPDKSANFCSDCVHREDAQFSMQIGGGSAELCYRPELLIDGGGSLCSVNRAEGGGCEPEGIYFEAKEESHGYTD